MNKTDRFIAADDLEPFYSGIDAFCTEFCELPDEDPGYKTLADPIEAYPRLAPWQVCIMDTPLFQRMREISQLGLADFVYPSVGYSRFEHVIGVLARLKEVLAHVKSNQSERGHASLPDLPTEKHVTTAHLAALCHDLGHCIFSHIGEEVLTRLPGRVSGFDHHHGRPSSRQCSSEACDDT